MNEPGEDIGQLAIYAQGQVFFDENEWASAYQEFYRLYIQDSEYEDVAKLCAEAAFRNAMRSDFSQDWKHQVEWLEKTVKIHPDHQKGQAQMRLDEARYQLAMQLLGNNDRRAAIDQLERITESYKPWAKLQVVLANACLEQGKEEYRWRHWQNALDWWHRAIVASKDLEGALQFSIRNAHFRIWLSMGGWWFILVGVICAVVMCAAGSFLWWQKGLSERPTVTPTVASIPTTGAPTVATLTIVPPTTNTTTFTPSPTSSQTPTPTATRTFTPSPSVTPTPTQTPSPTLAPIPPVIQPELLMPASGQWVTNTVEFKWKGSLYGDQVYKIRVARYNDKRELLYERYSSLKEQSWKVDLPADQTGGGWKWQVSVVSGVRVLSSSTEQTFGLAPQVGGGGGGGLPTHTP